MTDTKTYFTWVIKPYFSKTNLSPDLSFTTLLFYLRYIFDILFHHNMFGKESSMDGEPAFVPRYPIRHQLLTLHDSMHIAVAY